MESSSLSQIVDQNHLRLLESGFQRVKQNLRSKDTLQEIKCIALEGAALSLAFNQSHLAYLSP